MKFTIDNAIFKRFPGLKIGLVVAENLHNNQEAPQILDTLRLIESEVKTHFNLEGLIEHPKIAVWREAYRSFGVKPSTQRPSVEALIRRVLKKSPLPDINPLVNAYNAISLKYGLPLGGDDLQCTDGDIELTIAKGEEPFTMLGSQDVDQVSAGEIIYRDSKDVLCRAWNWRECDKSKITENSQKASLVIEGLESAEREEIEEAARELVLLIHKFSPKAKCHTFFLDKTAPSITL